MQSWQSLRVMAYTAGWQQSLSSTGPRREVHTSFKSLSCWHTVTDSKVKLPRTNEGLWMFALPPLPKHKGGVTWTSIAQVVHGLWSFLHGEKHCFSKNKSTSNIFWGIQMKAVMYEPWTQQVWFGFGFCSCCCCFVKDQTWGHAQVKQSFSLPLSSIISFLRVT